MGQARYKPVSSSQRRCIPVIVKVVEPPHVNRKFYDSTKTETAGKAAESNMWGWKHVTIHGGFDKGSGTKKWKCNHCHLRYNGSYSRVRAHLLGFSGVGIKGCPAVDRSMREAFLVLEEQRLARKKKKTSSGNPIAKPINKCLKTSHLILSSPSKTVSREDVDDTVARFFYADGLNINKEMVKALASFGPGYETPPVEKLSDSSLSKEKAKIERVIDLVKESWTHTGCTILCVNRLDSSLSCFCINFFIASPRGVIFLKAIDISEGDGADNLFVSILSDTIVEVGPTNVLQVITHLGEASFAFESVIVSKFPHIFWSHCASYSVFTLMEEIAEIDWMKNVFLCAKQIDQLISTYQNNCPTSQFIDYIKEYSNPLGLKFASYGTVHKVYWMKQALQVLVSSDEWKQWKLNIPEDAISYEASILDEDFWGRAHLMLQLFEPPLTLLSKLNIDKSVMGDIYNWRVQSLDALRSKGIDDIALNQMELIIETRWDMLFSPLHAVGYILNPKYYGKGQSKDKNVMRGWKATLERYESDSCTRRVVREQLSSYLRMGGSLGEEDAMECRDKMDPVAWWENFGFETPQLQTLAVKVLSQVSSVSVCDDSWVCKDSWMCKNIPCRKSVVDLGVRNVEDLVFVQNNLRLQSSKNGNGNMGCLSSSRNGDSCCTNGNATA
ncbi:hypothetical protein V2J09_020932 [Rumex salicifolius]